MNIKRQFRNMVVLIILLFIIIPLKAKEKSVLIGTNIMMFTPENFDAKSHLPSFALIEEPKEIGQKPNMGLVKLQVL
jgi:hypothetical protein